MPPLDEGTPLFVQIAEQLADDIVDGVLAEGARAPSTNELAAFYRINPATAAKGINVLVEDAVLEKRRGIGMFVAPGAQGQLRANRRKRFAEQFVIVECFDERPLLDLLEREGFGHAQYSSGRHSGGVQERFPFACGSLR